MLATIDVSWCWLFALLKGSFFILWLFVYSLTWRSLYCVAALPIAAAGAVGGLLTGITFVLNLAFFKPARRISGWCMQLFVVLASIGGCDAVLFSAAGKKSFLQAFRAQQSQAQRDFQARPTTTWHSSYDTWLAGPDNPLRDLTNAL